MLAELCRWEHWGRLCVIRSRPNEKGLAHTTCPVFVLKGECQSEKRGASKERHLRRILRMCDDLVSDFGGREGIPRQDLGQDTGE